MNQYYLENFDNPALSDEETIHCHLLRETVDGIIRVFDGKGKVGKAKIIRFNKKNVELEILETECRYRDYEFGLAFCLLKQKERFEWIIEKGTELGVTQFFPLISERTLRDKVDYKRVFSIALSAAKQSQLDFVPVIHKYIFTWELKCINDDFKTKLFGYCEEHEKKIPFSNGLRGRNILVLTGPEGDFTSKEAENMMELGFIPVSLGKTRLRAETAAIMAASLVKNHLDYA